MVRPATVFFVYNDGRQRRMHDEAVARCAERLRAARRVTVLTGAGVSAESGVPTFRGPEGLWKTFRPEELATPEAFARDPKLVWEWYDWRRQKVSRCKPNPAHLSLVRLEKAKVDFTLVTQNVDGLHHAAGSQNVVEVHGDIWRLRCSSCEFVEENRQVPLPEIPPRCACGRLLRPDVVWFGEPLPEAEIQKAASAASRAEVMLVVGTSSLVYPAASLPRLARESGAAVFEINAEPTPLTPYVDSALRGRAGEILPEVCRAAGLD